MSSILIGFMIFHYLVNQWHLFAPYYDYIMVMVIIITKLAKKYVGVLHNKYVSVFYCEISLIRFITGVIIITADILHHFNWFFLLID